MRLSRYLAMLTFFGLLQFLVVLYVAFIGYYNNQQFIEHKEPIFRDKVLWRNLDDLLSISRTNSNISQAVNRLRLAVDYLKDESINQKAKIIEISDQIHSNDDFLFFQKMTFRMKKRKATLSNACRDLGLDKSKFDTLRLLLSPKYKLAYCYIPKAGCSNMKKLILQLAGFNLTGLTNQDIHLLSLKNETREKKLPDVVLKQNYIKVLLVRHPYERLVSGYNNKILHPYDDGFKTFSEKMRILYGNASRKHEKDTPALFEEFVDYVSNGRNDGNKNGGEVHWSKYHSLCFPCLVDYDIIAHIETINEDIRYLLKLIGAPSGYQFGEGYTKTGQSETVKKNYVETYFKRLNTTQRENLYKAYESDFKLFGYNRSAS